MFLQHVFTHFMALFVLFLLLYQLFYRVHFGFLFQIFISSDPDALIKVHAPKQGQNVHKCYVLTMHINLILLRASLP